MCFCARHQTLLKGGFHKTAPGLTYRLLRSLSCHLLVLNKSLDESFILKKKDSFHGPGAPTPRLTRRPSGGAADRRDLLSLDPLCLPNEARIHFILDFFGHLRGKGGMERDSVLQNLPMLCVSGAEDIGCPSSWPQYTAGEPRQRQATTSRQQPSALAAGAEESASKLERAL